MLLETTSERVCAFYRTHSIEDIIFRNVLMFILFLDLFLYLSLVARERYIFLLLFFITIFGIIKLWPSRSSVTALKFGKGQLALTHFQTRIFSMGYKIITSYLDRSSIIIKLKKTGIFSPCYSLLIQDAHTPAVKIDLRQYLPIKQQKWVEERFNIAINPDPNVNYQYLRSILDTLPATYIEVLDYRHTLYLIVIIVLTTLTGALFFI